MTASQDEMANKKIEKLKTDHKNKLINLYNNYYAKAMDDCNAFKAFNDVSKELFSNAKDNELDNLLTNLKEGELTDE